MLLSNKLQKKNEKECFSQNRKYQTLSSITKESEDYKFFKFYIELEEQMFSIYSTQTTTSQQEEIMKRIFSTIERVKEQKHFFQFFVDLLVYHLLIRPKQTEITYNLLSHLLSNNENQRSFIIDTIQNNKFFCNSNNINIKDILYSHRIIEIY